MPETVLGTEEAWKQCLWNDFVKWERNLSDKEVAKKQMVTDGKLLGVL